MTFEEFCIKNGKKKKNHFQGNPTDILTEWQELDYTKYGQA